MRLSLSTAEAARFNIIKDLFQYAINARDNGILFYQPYPNRLAQLYFILDAINFKRLVNNYGVIRDFIGGSERSPNI